jgi:biotin carboxyl carrier protein
VAEIAVTPLGNGVYRVAEGSRSRVAYAAGSPDECWVFLDGNVHVLTLSKRKTADEHTALAAPMPATVIAVTAQPGQRVSKGDVLIVLEAMKMELPVKSPRDATVKAVTCRAGELVQPGVPLLELE